LERIIMAEAMQGVMSLAPEMAGMGAPSQTYLTPEDDATLNQLRNSISPQEFSAEMLNAAEQADPQAVAQLRTMLRGMQLPQELIDLMKEMVDSLLQEPAKYTENRQELIKEGVPEDLLPAEFDPMYLIALDMALDQVSQPVIQGFANGGMVRNPISAGIASLGRGGDRMLAHITPREARMLMRAGGAGTINPITGLPEFFLKKLFKRIGGAFVGAGKAIKSAVRSVGKAVQSFAKSTVGKIVTSVALGFFLGPAAAAMLGVKSTVGVAAISGFVGNAGASLLAGNSIQNALKEGAVGALTAGAVTGVTGGAAAFKTGSYTGPTTVSESWKQFTQSLPGKPAAAAAQTADEAATAAAQTADEAAAVSTRAGAGAPSAAQSVPNYKINPQTGLMEFDGTFTNYQTDALGRTVGKSTTGTPNFSIESAAQNLDDLRLDAIGGRTSAVPVDTGLERLSTGPTNLSSYTGPGARQTVQLSGTTPGVTTPTVAPAGTPNYLTGSLDEFGGPRMAPVSEPARNYLLESPTAMGGPNLPPVPSPAGSAAAPQQGVMSLLGEGKIMEAGKAAGSKIGDLYDEYVSPSGIAARGNEAAQQKALDAVNALPAGTSEAVKGSVFNRVYEANSPGLISQYAPIAALGTGAAYLGGAFDVEQPPKPDIPTSGAELYKRDPYIIEPDINTISASTGQPYEYGGFDPRVSTVAPSTGQAYDFSAQPYAPRVEVMPPAYAEIPVGEYRPLRVEDYRPMYAAKGGIASLSKNPQRFPRKTGPIDGPGTGTSDSIPAMLSDGEFVFTARAVRAMGNGSRRKGAKRMYALMKALEKRA